MIYMAAQTKKGLLVALAIDDVNLRRIKADDPLMARLANCGYSNGLFFVYVMSQDGGMSPRMNQIIEELKAVPTRLRVCALGLGPDELDQLKAGRFIKIQPGKAMRGIFQIALFYNSNPQKMLDSLRKAGLVTAATQVQIIPRDVSDN